MKAKMSSTIEERLFNQYDCDLLGVLQNVIDKVEERHNLRIYGRLEFNALGHVFVWVTGRGHELKPIMSYGEAQSGNLLVYRHFINKAAGEWGSFVKERSKISANPIP